MSEHSSIDTRTFVDLYDDAPIWSALFGEPLLEEVVLSAAQRIADLGCGTGYPTLELAARAGPSARVYGVDRWGAALERAVRKAESRAQQNVEFLCADVAALPFPDSSIDIVTGNLLVNNVNDPGAMVAEIERVLRPDGVCVFSTNAGDTFPEWLDLLERQHPEFGDSIEAERHRRLDEDGIAALFHAVGRWTIGVRHSRAVWQFSSAHAFIAHPFIRSWFVPNWSALFGADSLPAVAESWPPGVPFCVLIPRLVFRAARAR
ncbi:MAG: Methyltransferase type 11 [Candidatus Eremiobacteraeota bacterium]|nr:Methyltransferase type 11 [Candidatus Eremiobacteraeota bacterium]